MNVVRRERVRARAPEPVEIRCTVFDLMMQFAVPFAFFYDRVLDAEALLDGLERVLGPFAPFNARVVKRGRDLCLDCNDNGVSFSVVKSEHDARTALGMMGSPRQRELVELIDPKRALAKGEPLFTVRLTQFADGQSCLGVCWHHSVGDMHSFARFMQAWSHAVAGRSIPKPLVVEDRGAYLNEALPPDNGAKTSCRRLGFGEIARFALYALTTARDQRSLAFYFDPAEIAALRAALQHESTERLSTNDVLCAHMFSLIAERDPQPRTRNLAIVVDFRKRVGLPDTLIGNMVGGVTLPSDPGNEPSAIARDLRRRIDRFAADHMDYRANLRFVNEHGGIGAIPRFATAGFDPLGGTVLVSSWSKFGIYEVDFGGSCPTVCTPLGESPLPWITSLVEGFENRGAIFNAILPSSIADRLTQHEGLRAVHAHRCAPPRLPAVAQGLPWLF